MASRYPDENWEPESDHTTQSEASEEDENDTDGKFINKIKKYFCSK